MKAIGPYRLIAPLGEGGMGVVWRAQHEPTSAAVALKTVRAPDEPSIHSIRQEIRALGRIRHPGVVRILDHGVHDGLPWYAMELLQGRTFRDVLSGRPAGSRQGAQAQASTKPDPVTTQRMTGAGLGGGGARPLPGAPARSAPLGETLPILRELCQALSHLHAHGVVHRDLKPENVFVRDDGSPVLVDLGIAAPFAGGEGREEIGVAGRVMGSIAYMAPEQIRGDLVDARADLYALGCILYECLTGAPPFSAAKGSFMVHAHLFDPAVPPQLRADDVPDALDRLALRLLEKRPSDRLGYAEDVAEALRPFAGDGSAAASSTDDAVSTPAPSVRAPAYVYRADFSGREDILARFAAALDGLAVFRGGRWLVAGESGAGKTRLLLEMSRAAVRRRMAVVSAQCEPGGAEGAGDAGRCGGPLAVVWPLLVAMGDRCRVLGAGETARVFGPRVRVLAPYEPSLLSLPGAAGEPEPAPLPPDAARARVLRAAIECARAFTAGEPLLLLADDLQWADELSIALLDALGRPETAVPGLLLVGAYRAEEAGPALTALAESSGVEHVRLSHLREPDVRRIVADMLALRDPPETLVSFLTDVSSGNPFFLGEYLRAAIGEGLLSRDRSGTWQMDREAAGRIARAVPFPQRLADLVDLRLARLGDAVRPVVEAAGVLGREMAASLLAVVAGLDEGTTLDAVETMRVRQVLEEPRPGVLRFVHDKIRETAYARIEGERRRDLHRRAAAAIEAKQGDGPEVAGALGHHHARSDQPARAAVLFERAADHARARYANEEAIGHYRAAIEQAERVLAPGRGDEAAAGKELPERSGKMLPGEPGRMLPGLGERLGDVLALVGRHEEARAAFEEAIRRLGEGEPLGTARLRRKVGKAWEVHHMHEEALRAFDAAEAVLGWSPDVSDTERRDLWVQIQIDRISIHYWKGEIDQIDGLVGSVRPLVERHGTLVQRASLFQALVQRNIRRERYATSAETVELTRACLAAREELGEPGQILTTRFALATVLLWHGALGEAEERMAAALADAEHTGDAHHEARCLTYLSILYRLQGRVDDARGLVDRSLEVTARARLADHEGAALASAAWVSFRDGGSGEAERAGREALSRWKPISSAYAFPFQWTARIVLLALSVERGRPSEAAEHARDMLDEKQQRLPDEITGPLLRGLDAWQRGDAEASLAELGGGVAAARALHRL